MFRFVKERGDEIISIKRQKFCVAVENESVAREMYESVLQIPSTSTAPVKSQNNTEHRKSRRITLPFNKNKLFAAVVSNDVTTIEEMNITNRNVNVTDQFGWTALMMAVCDGHLDAVKVLIRRGANIDIENKQNDTALKLAEKRKHQLIIEFLKQKQTETIETICLSSDDDQTSSQRFFCDICQTEFLQIDQKSHEASTLHRFNRENLSKSAPHFGIAESNVGFRMLMKQGWDRESGLGAKRDGIIYPIKTTLRKPRSGLGVRQPNKPKVTHFKPFDCDAIKSGKPISIKHVKTKRQLRAEQLRTQRKDRQLRKLLS
ncbi:G patch domain and ankyrin repeat-containing protein 1 homolog [Contarinia nasturtii]|uniref:G patch domain and ankyrin repeat-containing protein 1 homolog n=1 Tax=Contarinia nasturtii TaxID=265458 RepID=UPI0012D4C09D|nr:G patch domain and ankyrin repeat-containing protein 1 homolog [Contarinia nasturtii]XP_031636850.1 G patch domain and ankyrin repeat-containing protein 1 homolog [Contarinia nasturtii]